MKRPKARDKVVEVPMPIEVEYNTQEKPATPKIAAYKDPTLLKQRRHVQPLRPNQIETILSLKEHEGSKTKGEKKLEKHQKVAKKRKLQSVY